MATAPATNTTTLFSPAAAAPVSCGSSGGEAKAGHGAAGDVAITAGQDKKRPKLEEKPLDLSGPELAAATYYSAATPRDLLMEEARRVMKQLQSEYDQVDELLDMLKAKVSADVSALVNDAESLLRKLDRLAAAAKEQSEQRLSQVVNKLRALDAAVAADEESARAFRQGMEAFSRDLKP